MKKRFIDERQISIFDLNLEKHRRCRGASYSIHHGPYYNCFTCDKVLKRKFKDLCKKNNHYIMDAGFLWKWEHFLVAEMRRALRKKILKEKDNV